MVAAPLRGLRSEGERWSLACFALAVIGLGLSIWIILASETDPAHVRWWLVAAPSVITAIPLLLPRQHVRFASMIGLGAWCTVTGFSIGMLLLPALLASVAAVVKDGE